MEEKNREEKRREETRRDETRRDEKRREEKKKEDHKRESLRRKKIQVPEKVGKSRNTEKLHAVVARSTFRSQNVQNTPGSQHFWKLRCRKSARRGGAKHISKSKCTKHTMLGPLLEVEMSKKCTPLWREAHVEVKMYKTHHARTTFGN